MRSRCTERTLRKQAHMLLLLWKSGLLWLKRGLLELRSLCGRNRHSFKITTRHHKRLLLLLLVLMWLLLRHCPRI